MPRLIILIMILHLGASVVYGADPPLTPSAAQAAAVSDGGEAVGEIEEPSEAVPDGEESPARNTQFVTRYRLDSRVMNQTGSGSEFDVMAAEAEVFATVGTRLDAAVQIPLKTAMEGRGRDMHFGNVYAVIKGKIGQPTLKVGQFVIPFGNLADYETHTRVLQTLYPYSLGARIDPGVQVDGFLGKDTEYSVAVTTGNGPYHGDIDGNKVVTARVARRMQIGEDDLKVGISALKGRLPVFSTMTDPLMDGKSAKLVYVTTGELVPQDSSLGFADKTRYAVDIEYYRGIDLIRAELVRGTDDGKSVGGYWLQVEHPLNYKTSLIGLVGRWDQTHGDWSNLAVGVEHKLEDTRILRLAFERRRSSEMDMSMNMNMITLQYLTEF